ncbi:MAG: argininosuccinate lyase [Chloroflexi bacterium]|nr:argininosuccinate lyase [Chloroflexota bacterium]
MPRLGGMREVTSAYTVSIHYDRRLYRQDIAGSIAHARMLAKQGIIDDDDATAITNGLQEILQEIEDGSFEWRPELEDIHMNVENRLHEKIGEAAGRLHTARSRNDQIALDIRMFAKDAINEVLDAVHDLRSSIVLQSEANITAVMPGYTHVQRAQPVLFAHHMLAYFEMLGRDADRFRQAYDRADVLPLGSGALAGLPYPIDREFVARELGFSRISRNSMDAVADRDFLLDFQSAAAICMMHLSRMAEELVLWSSDEFAFTRLSDEYTTGSSIMPQKRNPDFAELARGKTGRVFGGLMALLTLMKGLPLTYNRDMQEDKEGFFDTFDTLLATLTIFADMIDKMHIVPERMREAAQGSYVLATDIADYLVDRGMPFREAHGVVARLSEYAVGRGVQFEELSLDEYRSFSDLFDEEVLAISVESSVGARDVPGGTAFSRVKQAVVEAKTQLLSEQGAESDS